MPDYPPEKLWPLYEKLPKDLQEAIFSEKTAETIYDVGTQNGLEKEKISEVAKYTGYVLLGVLPPAEFQKTLKEELNLNDELAKRIDLEIARYIFDPVNESLTLLYKMKLRPAKLERFSMRPEVGLSPEIKPPVEKRPEKVRKDIYREPIE